MKNVHRAQLRVELDAYYARLCGLTRDELRYTPFGVDPKEVYSEDFPGETSACLRRKKSSNLGRFAQVAPSRERGEWRRRIGCLLLS
jgi:hypothetical protein